MERGWNADGNYADETRMERGTRIGTRMERGLDQDFTNEGPMSYHLRFGPKQERYRCKLPRCCASVPGPQRWQDPCSLCCPRREVGEATAQEVREG